MDEYTIKNIRNIRKTSLLNRINENVAIRSGKDRILRIGESKNGNV